MGIQQPNEFIKGVERLVRPQDVTAISFFNTYTRLLPKFVQRRLMESTAKKIPHMGFVVEPYSFFLCHKIQDIEYAKTLITDEYELTQTRIFGNDEPGYYVIFGCFTAHTSAFWGNRIEMYIIATHKKTGKITWIIVDYDTNTNSYDPKRGLTAANSLQSVMTTTHHGTMLVHMERDDKSRALNVEADITKGVMQPLDQPLWLAGNLSVDYGTLLTTKEASPFSLIFDPLEAEQALSIPVANVRVVENTWYPGLYEKAPSAVVSFPYAQHFVAESVQGKKAIDSQEQLIAAANELGDLGDQKGFSAAPLKRQLILGIALSNTISAGIIVFLLYKLITKQ